MMFFFLFFGFFFKFFFNILLTWKIVEASKASVLYIYIDYTYFHTTHIYFYIYFQITKHKFLSTRTKYPLNH